MIRPLQFPELPGDPISQRLRGELWDPNKQLWESFRGARGLLWEELAEPLEWDYIVEEIRSGIK